MLLLILPTLLSAGAFIIACITLWFTHLKGPDIDLISEVSDLQVEEVPFEKYTEYIPYDLDFKPIDLVFANKGSRTGVIKEIAARFEPPEGFKPFFKVFWSMPTRILPEKAEGIIFRELPVPIREGEKESI